MNTKRNLTFGYNAITNYLQLENVPQVNTFEFRDRMAAFKAAKKCRNVPSGIYIGNELIVTKK